MIKIRNLQKSYGSFKVLNGLDMNVSKGDVYGFLGKNGCGKTTTMNILCNIIAKDGGDIFVGENGEKIKIGYLPETPMMFGNMNAYEYLEYIAACGKYQGDIKARIDEVLELVALKSGGERKIKGYSRGMNQRLGIAATIFNNPELVILDEPTSALDPEGRADVMDIIQRLSNLGVTILLCTHILSDVERVANKVGIVRDGRIVIEGEINQILLENGKKEIEMKLFEPSAENAAKIKALEGKDAISKVDFYEKTGIFVLRSEETEKAVEQITQLLAQEKITASKLDVVTDNLEKLYLKVVNGNV